MFNRELSSTLRSSLSYFPAVAVLGPRQVGKTTLVKSLLADYPKEVTYLDLEYFADQRRLQQPDLFFQANQDKVVVLDEIQRMPELFPLLRSMIDQHRVAGRFSLGRFNTEADVVATATAIKSVVEELRALV